jgi:hypothetical protein
MCKKLFFVFTLLSFFALEAKECTIFTVFKNAVIIDGYDFIYDAEKGPFPLNVCDIVDIEYEREELPDDGYRLTATVTSQETGQSQRLISPILSDKQYIKIAKVEKVRASVNSLGSPTMMGGSRVSWDYRYEAILTLENGASSYFKAMVAGLRTEEDAKRGLQATEERLREGCYLEIVKDDTSHFPVDIREIYSESTLYTPEKEPIVSGRLMGSALKRGKVDAHPIFYTRFEGWYVKFNDNGLNTCVRPLHPRSFEFLHAEYENGIEFYKGPGYKIVKIRIDPSNSNSIILEYRRDDGDECSIGTSCPVRPNTTFQYVRSYKSEEGELVIVLKHLGRNKLIEFVY